MVIISSAGSAHAPGTERLDGFEEQITAHGRYFMAKKCEMCGKTPQVGFNVSHANNKTKRRFKPNLQRVRAQTPSGAVKRMKVCTRCLRNGSVRKPAIR